MKQKAIEKLTRECEANTSKPIYNALVYIEEHYTNVMNEKIAEKILQEDKNLMGAYRKIESFAKAGHLYCVTDEEGFSITDNYFGIVPEDYSSAKLTKVQKNDSDEFDILDLL